MKRIFKKFSIYDLVVIAIMSAIGIAIKPVVVPLAHVIAGPLMIPSGALAGGLYMMWLVVGYGIVRKPGTATLIGVIQALIVILTGIIGSHGIMSFLTYVAPGIAMDLVLLVMRHRVCCRPCAVVAGAVANITGTACVNIVFFQAPGIYLVLMLSVAALSGIIGGLIAWELIKIMQNYRLVPSKKNNISEFREKQQCKEVKISQS